MLHDPLTSLLNRQGFYELLRSKEETAEPIQSIVTLELTNFGSLNASLGSSTGDKVIKTSANRLRKIFPDSSGLARLNGDSFGICFDTTAKATEIQEKVNDFLQRPFFANGKIVVLGARLGVAHRCEEDGLFGEALVNCAEVALHHANKCQVDIVRYSDELHHTAQTHYDLQNQLRAQLLLSSTDLHRGASGEHFKIDHTVIQNREGQLTGYLVSPQWQLPDSTLMDADEFISVAEAVLATDTLLNWVVTHAITMCHENNKQGSGELSYCINLGSAVKFDTTKLLELLRGHLLTHEIGAGQIKLCISCRHEPNDCFQRFYDALTQCGVSLILKDFGGNQNPFKVLTKLKPEGVFISEQFDPERRSMNGTPDLLQGIFELLACCNIDSYSTFATPFVRHPERSTHYQIG